MTLSITLEANVATASVLVTVRESGAVPSRPFTLTRSDANGIAPVRLLAGQGIGTGALVVTDGEAALSGPIAYTAAYGGGESIASTTVLAAPRDVLAVPVMPQLRVESTMTSEITATRASRSTVHEPIGRADPVVTLAPLGLRTGRVGFTVRTRAEADGILAVMERAAVLHLRFAEQAARDLYFVATDADVALENGTGAWTVTASYVETARPSAPLAGTLGWTWADVARLGSWAAVRDGFATWADLTAGRTR